MLPPGPDLPFSTQIFYVPKHVLSLSAISSTLVKRTWIPFYSTATAKAPPLLLISQYSSIIIISHRNQNPTSLSALLLPNNDPFKSPLSFSSYLIINLYLLFHWRSLRFPLLLRLTLLILLKWTLILHPMAQTLYPCMELNSQNQRYHHNRIPDRNSLNHWYRCVQTHCRTPDRNARIPISHFQNRM